MGQSNEPTPVLLLLAAISRHQAALDWVHERAVGEYGPVALVSTAFKFTETDYYTATMGTGLKKQFFAFEKLIDPGQLATVKRRTNDWEAEYATVGQHAEPRPLNLDPGYLTLAKLVLASTKDHAHRIYLEGGIFAEVTLNFRGGRWQRFEWTYPDYQRADYHEFFTECRHLLRPAV